MFDENRLEMLEKQVTNLAVRVHLSLTHEKAMEERKNMMKLLRDIYDNHKSVRLWGNKQVVAAITLGFDDRYKQMLSSLARICDSIVVEIEATNKIPDMKKMYELEDMIHDLKNWRI